MLKLLKRLEKILPSFCKNYFGTGKAWNSFGLDRCFLYAAGTGNTEIAGIFVISIVGFVIIRLVLIAVFFGITMGHGFMLMCRITALFGIVIMLM